MIRNCFFAFAALLVVLGGTAKAATVSFSLDLSTPGEFSLFAEEIDGDNSGIASYGVALGGGITSLDHASPNVGTAQSADPFFGAAGFTFLRTPDSGLSVAGSQDTIGPTPHIIYGFGQATSSFAAEGLTPLTPVVDPVSWDAKLLLARGTWQGEEPTIDIASALTLSNVFVGDGAATRAAEVCIDCGGTLLPVAVGDPAGSSDSLNPAPFSMQGAFDDYSGMAFLEVFNGEPTSNPVLEILGVNISANDSGLFGAELVGADNTGGPYDIKLSLDVPGAQKLPLGTIITADVEIETNGGNLYYQLSASVPEPSTVVLSSLALVGLVGLARYRS